MDNRIHHSLFELHFQAISTGLPAPALASLHQFTTCGVLAQGQCHDQLKCFLGSLGFNLSALQAEKPEGGEEAWPSRLSPNSALLGGCATAPGGIVKVEEESGSKRPRRLSTRDGGAT